MALGVLAISAHLLRVPQFAEGVSLITRRFPEPGGGPQALPGYLRASGLNETGSMRSRYPSGSNFAYSFGPGPVSPAVKALLIANIAVFLLQQVVAELPLWFGLRPIDVVAGLQIWQTLTYMFLHGSISHILFNMLSLWMFGTELERMWGTRFFARYYLVCGVGAAATTILVSFFPGAIGERLYDGPSIVGASGAITVCSSPTRCTFRTGRSSCVPLPRAGEVTS